MTNAGLYVHVPFCLARCTYCDFCSFTERQDAQPRYVDELLSEAHANMTVWQNVQFDTLYIGGGTPTSLNTELLARLIAGLTDSLPSPPTEFTVEANPGTVDLEKLRALRNGGVNRLSLGVQSMNDQELTLMGRIHDASEAASAVATTRQAGIDNISLDLIYGVPFQTMETWKHTLLDTLALEPTHLSLYALTLNENVPMARQIASHQLPSPDEALAADMYELARELLATAGFSQYEISNWALQTSNDTASGMPSLASRHNLHYWKNEPYRGLGTAAYSFDGIQRWGNTTDLDAYMQGAWTHSSSFVSAERLNTEQRMDETAMLELRLLQGINLDDFRSRFGRDLLQVYEQAIDESVDEELLERHGDNIRLTPRGLLLGNRVFARFLRN